MGRPRECTPHQVFISYSTRDARDQSVAQAVCEHLELQGIACWMAPRDIPSGAKFAEALIHAIDASRVLVLVFSSRANLSEYVYREVQEAVDKGIPIIPFRIEDVEPSNGMRLLIKAIQWLDALPPPPHRHFQKLADRVSALLGVEAGSAGVRQPAEPHGRPWMPLMTVVLVLALAAGAAGVWRAVQQAGSKGAPAPVSPADLPGGPPTSTSRAHSGAPTREPSVAGSPADVPTIDGAQPQAGESSVAMPTARAEPSAAPPVEPEAPSEIPAWDAWTEAGSFPAPGASPQEIFRQGDRLWVEVKGGVFGLSVAGEILDEASAGECQGIWAWDGASLWVISGRQVSTCIPAEWRARSVFEHDLLNPRAAAWDGSSLWIIDVDGNLARYDAAGRRLQRLAVPVDGWPISMCWVGTELWVAMIHGPVARFDGRTFEPVGGFDTEECGVGWAPGDLGISWDGESLWIAETDASRIRRCVPGQ